MREYLSIPEKGINDAGIVHLVLEGIRGPLGEPLKLCTGESYSPPEPECEQVVFCEACRILMLQRSTEAK